MAYIKYSRTLSGGVSVQVAASRGRTTEIIKHLGTAHDDLTLQALIDQAEEFMGIGVQMSMDIGVDVPARLRPTMADISNYHAPGDDEQLILPVDSSGKGSAASSAMAPLKTDASSGASSLSPRVVDSPARLTWDVLAMIYTQLGFDVLGDEAFMSTVIARVVKPTSKARVPAVLGTLGRPQLHENTIYNALKRCHTRGYQDIYGWAYLAWSAKYQHHSNHRTVDKGYRYPEQNRLYADETMLLMHYPGQTTQVHHQNSCRHQHELQSSTRYVD